MSDYRINNIKSTYTPEFWGKKCAALQIQLVDALDQIKKLECERNDLKACLLLIQQESKRISELLK